MKFLISASLTWLLNMGKVRKLRRKYRALCVAEKSSKGSEIKVEDGSFDNKAAVSKKNVDDNFDLISRTSISKSIKSHFGLNVSKKEKQLLRHALFLESEWTHYCVFLSPFNNSVTFY